MIKFISKYFIIILLLVVAISYGQMLGMYVYQDDNAIFFKLAHLEGNAGFLGPGPFGEGPYKYSATPYIPIYSIFGYNTIAYYGLAFAFYFLASVCVYLVFYKIVGKNEGRISGFLFAAGYIASDGFFRLYNTITTSFTVILASLIFYFYWRFYQSGKLKWYLASLPLFWAAIEFGQSRTHYLIAVAVLFELVFLTFKKPLTSAFSSVLRISPFVYIFYRYFLQNADSRSGQITQYFAALFRGEFFQSFGVLTTLADTIIPDWITNFPPLRALLLSLSSLFWKVGGRIFASPVLEIPEQARILLFLGTLLIVSFLALVWVIKDSQKKKIFIFLSLWMLANIVAYSAYMPLVTYESIHRYLAHSFLPLVGILGLLTVAFQKRNLQIICLSAVLLWGVGNLAAAFTLQKNILADRSIPSRSFYEQLRSAVPELKKGDILYFDVADSAGQRFSDAIIVSQMPDTASLAWKYGVDRYDFKRFIDFENLTKEIKTTKSSGDNIYSFFYDGNTLTDTTRQFRAMLQKTAESVEVKASLPKQSTPSFQKLKSGTLLSQSAVEVNFKEPLSGIFPTELEASILAVPVDYSQINCPCLFDGAVQNKAAADLSLVFGYRQYKNNFFKTAKITTSSQWQDRVTANIFDRDNSTVWQNDRIKWRPEKAFILIDLGEMEQVNRLVWVNGFTNNTPTNYSIQVSQDGESWQMVKQVDNLQKINTKEPQVVEFPAVDVRFVKMAMTGTISNDSPAIAEIWVVPNRFATLDIAGAEKVIERPFAHLQDSKTGFDILRTLNYQGRAKYYWKSNKHDSWMSREKSVIDITYDNILRKYKFVIPAGGTEISAIKIAPITIPGDVTVSKLFAKPLPIEN